MTEPPGSTPSESEDSAGSDDSELGGFALSKRGKVM